MSKNQAVTDVLADCPDIQVHTSLHPDQPAQPVDAICLESPKPEQNDGNKLTIGKAAGKYKKSSFIRRSLRKEKHADSEEISKEKTEPVMKRSTSVLQRMVRKQNKTQKGETSVMTSSVYVELTTYETIKSKSMRNLFRAICDRASPNIIARATTGFIFGILLSALVYLAIYYGREVYNFSKKTDEPDMPPTWSVAICAGAGMLWSMGLAFSVGVRCITLLMLPALFTTRGRAFVCALLLQLLMAGPILNTVQNAEKLPEATSCNARLLYNQSRVIQEIFLAHFKNITENYRQLTAKMVNTTIRMVDQHFDTFKNVIKQFRINSSFEIYDITLFGLTFTRDILNPRYSNKPKFNYNYEAPDVDSSTPSDLFIRIIRGTVIGFINFISDFIYVLNWLLPLSVVLLFMQSYFYLRGYTRRLAHDNIFITKNFHKLDKSRKKKGKPSILPLRNRERSKYIDSTSICLSRRERESLTLGLLITFLLLMIGAVAYIVDLSFYIIIDALGKQLNTTLSFKGGLGIWPTLPEDEFDPNIRTLLLEEYPEFFASNFSMMYDNSLDTASCTPNFSQPTVYSPILIVSIVLWLFILVVSLLQSYGLRLQHKVASFFYPEIERRRIKFLYDQIQAQRISFGSMLLLHTFGGDQAMPTWSQWLRGRYPRMAKTLLTLGVLSPPTCEVCGLQEELLFNVAGYLCCEACKLSDPAVLEERIRSGRLK